MYEVLTSILLDKDPEVCLLDHVVFLVLILSGTLILFSKMAIPFCIIIKSA